MGEAKGNHLKALLRKNWIQWKRQWLRSCNEMLLPAILTVLTMSVFRGQVKTTPIPELAYFNSEKDFATLYPNIPTGVLNSTGQPVIPPLVNCIDRIQPSRGTHYRNGYVALVTDSNSIIDDVETMIKTVYGYDTKRYSKLDDLFKYTTSLEYGWDVCFAIEFPAPVNDKYAYKLIFNNTGPPTREFDDVPDTLRDLVYPYKTEYKDPLFDLWKKSGFLSLQNYIDNLILRKETGVSTAEINAKLYPIKSPAYTQDTLDLTLKNNFGPFIVLPMILSFLRLTQGLLLEKEKKIREGMKIMGMRNTSFYGSWIITYFVIYSVMALFLTIALKISVFKLSNFLLMFIWLWLFCVSLIFQALFISSFFTKSRVGMIVGMLFFLFNYMIDFTFQGGNNSTSLLVGASFSSHVGVKLACEVFLVLEANASGIGFAEAGSVVSNYCLNYAILMTLLNIAVFGLLSLYLDQVLPNEFGKKKKPLFFLDYLFNRNSDAVLNSEELRKKRRENKKKNDAETSTGSLKNIEEVTQLLVEQESRSEVLKINHLQKVFEATGEAKGPFTAVDKLNLTMYKNQIFVLLGHNGAGKTTTLSMLSGLLEMTDGWAEVNGLDVETQMEEIRTFMGVCPQHDILFDDLTVKEHLELFASFKGMSDPQKIEEEVNKFIDDVDLKEKTNVLSKNLSGGQKRRLSVAIAFIGGSQLVYLDEPTSGMDTSARRYVWDMLKQYRNDRIVILTTHFMDEADYLGDRIGIMGKGKLICCGSSEFLKDRYGVGYNLTIVKEDNNVSSDPIIGFVKSVIPSAHILSNVSSEITVQLKNDSIQSFSQLFLGLDTKKKELKIESYGISITTLEEVFLRVAELNQHENSASNIEHNKKKEVDQEEDDQVDNFDLNSVRIKDSFALFMHHSAALSKKRMIYFSRDTRSLLCEVLIPFIVVIAGLCITLIQIIIDSPSLVILPSIYSTPLSIIYSGSATQSDMSALVSNLRSSDWKTELFSTTSKQVWDDKNFEMRAVEHKGSYFFNSIDTTNKKFNYEAEVQTISKDTPPLFLNQMNNAILRMATGNPNKNIELTFNPFPLPKSVQGFEATSDGIISAFIFSIALSLIPASLISFTVSERVENVKHQQLVCGVGLSSYWLSNYLIDFVKYLIPAVLSLIAILIFQIDTFTNDDAFGAIVLLFILYGFAVIPFTYAAGFIFNNTGSAQVSIFFFNFVLGSIGPLVIMILRLIKTTKSAALKIQWILRMFPSFGFGYGIVNIANKSLYATAVGETKQAGTYDLDIAGGDILMLGIQGIFYYTIIFIIEHFKNKKSVSDLIQSKDDKYVSQAFDSDVQKEMDLIAKSDPKDYSVRVNDLRKVYYAQGNDPKVAVDRVSFGIKEGDCFALLGVNGAGKTTTFKILSGEIQPTSGHTHIKGYDLRTQMQEAQQHIGYCPQFDALIANLTAREHLNLYAAIKGIPSNLRDKLVSQKIKEMGLSEFENKCAGTYSGGNKRKLSVAIAMLGNPPIVFLDEPSTGMDPEARRFMWNVISRISTKRKQSSVILTTHSMEEAEALCTKLTIMVNGTFKCLGTLTQIKNKFGQGYEVVVKTEIPKEQANKLLSALNVNGQQKLVSLEEVEKLLGSLQRSSLMKEITEEGSGKVMFQNITRGKGITAEQLAEFACIEKDGEQMYEFIKKNLGEFSVIEHFSNLYRFKLMNTSISIGKVFDMFEKNKTQLNIASYNVRQATIEQIFNNFAEGRYDKMAQQQLQQQQQQQQQQQKLQIQKSEPNVNLGNEDSPFMSGQINNNTAPSGKLKVTKTIEMQQQHQQEQQTNIVQISAGSGSIKSQK